MRARHMHVAGIGLAAVVIVATGLSSAGAPGGKGGPKANSYQETLSGYQEDPLVLSTTGSGEFVAQVDTDAQQISYSLSYDALEGDVLQAHIHLGGQSQSGAISVFLCTNLGNGPAGIQPCPPAPATVSGTISAGDVLGPAAQGIAAGEFDELVAALRAGATYVNVHSAKYPGGEIRAQLGSHH